MQEWESNLDKDECNIIINRHLQTRERVLWVMKRTRNFKRIDKLVYLNTLLADDVVDLILRRDKL